MADRLPPKTARPVRDCQHTQVQHEHGTRAAYVLDRCGCSPCTQANTAGERRRTTGILYGAPGGLIDAEPARRHVKELREAGLSLVRIAALSGVGQGTVNALVYGVPVRQQPPPAHVRSDTARRLLAVQFDPNQVAAGRRIDATGTHRRLQALATLGWSIPALAVRAELTSRSLRRALTTTTVTADTARTIAALYDHLHATPAPRRTAHERAAAKKAAAHARTTGWAPPHAWDDIDNDPPDNTDDPAADTIVDDVAVERAMNGQPVRLTPTERREAVARLTRRGLSARRIAELLHTTSRTIVRVRGANRAAA